MTPLVPTPPQRPAQSALERPRETRSPLVHRRVSLGSPVPRLNLLAFVLGQYMPLDSSSLSGRWLALCFPGSLHPAAHTCLNVQGDVLRREGVVMLLALSDARLRRLADREALQVFTAPIVTDPLNRLHRSYGVQRRLPFSQPATFVIGPDRILRLEFDHALNGTDFDLLRGVLRATPGNCRSSDGSATSQREVSHVLCAP